jgi:hypothetical protein
LIDLHLNLDDAWMDEPFELPRLDAREWGGQLRFCAPSRVVEKFYREIENQLAPFILYGSGDFHYLTALWIRRFGQVKLDGLKPSSSGGAITVVSFDNHPDWAITPPRWAAGGWVNRALELAHVRRVSVWGCGNFECWWPHSVLRNFRAERTGKLEVHPWADERPANDRQRRGTILRDNWRQHFEKFATDLRGRDVYVTIDLDCLRGEEAVTNWENGRFAIVDLVWALGKLRQSARIVGGDICGAYSEPAFARWKQRFASEWDHPKLTLPEREEIRRINFASLKKLWPALTSSE